MIVTVSYFVTNTTNTESANYIVNITPQLDNIKIGFTIVFLVVAVGRSIINSGRRYYNEYSSHYITLHYITFVLT